MTARTVAIVAFDEMEVLDYAGPYEVFNVAGELSDPSGPPAFSPISVSATGPAGGPVSGRGGFRVLPDHGLDDCPPTDLLLVPGGAGARALLDDERLLGWLRERAGEVEELLSVCTGALVLGAAGLLERRHVTTHHTAIDELAALVPSARVERGPRFLRSGERLWTSAGVSAGIDLALHQVARLAGEPLRDAVVAEMEWQWRS